MLYDLFEAPVLGHGPTKAVRKNSSNAVVKDLLRHEVLSHWLRRETIKLIGKIAKARVANHNGLDAKLERNS